MKTTSAAEGGAGPRNRKWSRLLGVPMALGFAVIMTACAGNKYERSTGESIDDTSTTGRVKRALAADHTYRYPDVKVTTFKGNVQLSGFVERGDQKEKATELAKAVPGVKDVENRITVK